MTAATLRALGPVEGWLLRAAGALLSRRGARASVVVLIYHRVLPEPDPLLPHEPDARAFAAQMDLIAAHFNVLPLREAVRRLRDRSLPERAVCVTFDDGYANNCEIALPLLAARRIPATVFVAAGYLNGGRMFNDTVLETFRRAPPDADIPFMESHEVDLSSPAGRLRTWERAVLKLKYLAPEERRRSAEGLAERLGIDLPKNLMMTDSQVLALHRAGIEIGAHTMSHPILTRIDGRDCLSEMRDSRRRLEEITGHPVRSFAYPNGRPMQDYDRSHVALAAQAGFDVAVSTAWGTATAASDPLQIPRIAPWDREARRYAMRLVRAYRERRFAVA